MSNNYFASDLFVNKVTDDRSSFIIRPAREQDATALMELMDNLVKNSNAYSIDRLFYSLDRYVSYIKDVGKNNLILVAEMNDELLGWLTLARNIVQFRRHTANIIIGVKPTFQHQCIGSKLIETVEPMALFMNVERLELVVREQNINAYQFFLKNGFIYEGKRMKSLKQDGIYENEILMAKILR